MEVPSQPFINKKKLSNLARLSLFMIRKGFSKSKLVLDDIQFLMKRGKIIGKALKNDASLSCRPRDVHLSFVSPMEYEFSCRTSPSNQPYVPNRSKRNKTRYPYNTLSSSNNKRADVGGMFFGSALMVCRDAGDFESPLVVQKGRGQRRRPAVLQVRETTPFVLKEDFHEEYRVGVDEAAEEFIQKFYTQLRLQRWLAVVEASDQYYG